MSIDYKYGATVLKMGNASFGAFTLGSFIVGDKNIEADASNTFFQHEYGHYIQSQQLGPSYLFRAAIPSFVSAILNTPEDHDKFIIEKDANYEAYSFFSQNIPDFEKKNIPTGRRGSSPDTEDVWNYKRNPIEDYDFNLSVPIFVFYYLLTTTQHEIDFSSSFDISIFTRCPLLHVL